MNKEDSGHRQWATGLLGGIVIAFISIGFMYYLMQKVPIKVTETKTQVVYDLNDSYSEQKVMDYLLQLNVKYPKVALAQMKLESANGTSKIFKEGNNLFGMKVPVRRPTTALGEKDNHAYYSHWRQAVIDYALFQAFVSNTENMNSESDWLDYISHTYASDTSYRNKLVHIKNNLK